MWRSATPAMDGWDLAALSRKQVNGNDMGTDLKEVAGGQVTSGMTSLTTVRSSRITGLSGTPRRRDAKSATGSQPMDEPKQSK